MFLQIGSILSVFRDGSSMMMKKIDIKEFLTLGSKE